MGRACPSPWRFTSVMSLLDHTKRGLEAHLQTIVLDLIVDEQMDTGLPAPSLKASCSTKPTTTWAIPKWSSWKLASERW